MRRPDSTAVICAAVLLAAGAAALAPGVLPVACPSVRWLGVECPGCGLTRAFAALVHGHAGEAWALHPWAFVLFPLAAWGVVRPLARRAWPESSEKRPDAATRDGASWQTWATTLLLLAFGLWAVARALARL